VLRPFQMFQMTAMMMVEQILAGRSSGKLRHGPDRDHDSLTGEEHTATPELAKLGQREGSAAASALGLQPRYSTHKMASQRFSLAI
jgi:hypothetical protein